MRRLGAEIGLARPKRVATDMREIASAGIGVVIEEHRDVVRLRPPLAELARGDGCLRAFLPGVP